MRSVFFSIISVLMFQIAGAQDEPVPEGTTFAGVTVTSSTSTPADANSGKVTYLEYKSVYDAPTLEEEVKMATERFRLSKPQQEIWLTAAEERRQTEKQVYDKLRTTDVNYDKGPDYRALRTSHNAFFEEVVGYLNPAQKEEMEFDRAILQEKQNRIAKLPPPPPPPSTVTVVSVDTAAIILQAEKKKEAEKKAKSKNKKKPAASKKGSTGKGN